MPLGQCLFCFYWQVELTVISIAEELVGAETESQMRYRILIDSLVTFYFNFLLFPLSKCIHSTSERWQTFCPQMMQQKGRAHLLLALIRSFSEQPVSWRRLFQTDTNQKPCQDKEVNVWPLLDLANIWPVSYSAHARVVPQVAWPHRS